jgi:hypothetical protein
MLDLLDGPDKDLIPHQMLAEALGKKPSTLAAWRTHGSGPPFFKVGSAVYYQRGDVRAWLESRRVRSAAAGRLLNARTPGSRARTANHGRGKS